MITLKRKRPASRGRYNLASAEASLEKFDDEVLGYLRNFARSADRAFFSGQGAKFLALNVKLLRLYARYPTETIEYVNNHASVTDQDPTSNDGAARVSKMALLYALSRSTVGGSALEARINQFADFKLLTFAAHFSLMTVARVILQSDPWRIYECAGVGSPPHIIGPLYASVEAYTLRGERLFALLVSYGAPPVGFLGHTWQTIRAMAPGYLLEFVKQGRVTANEVWRLSKSTRTRLDRETAVRWLELGLDPEMLVQDTNAQPSQGCSQRGNFGFHGLDRILWAEVSSIAPSVRRRVPFCELCDPIPSLADQEAAHAMEEERRVWRRKFTKIA